LRNSSTSSSKVFQVWNHSDLLRCTLKGITFLALGIVVFVVLSSISSYCNLSESMLEMRVTELLRSHVDTKAINVGHSHNVAIDYSVLEYEGYHAWYSASDFFEVEYELRNLVPQLKELKAVFMPVGYFGFHQDHSLSETGRTHRVQFYKTFGAWPPIKGDLWLYLRGKIDNVVRLDHWKIVATVVLHGREGTDTVLPQDGHRIQADDFEPMTYEELVEFTTNSPSGVAAHLKGQDPADKGHPNLAEDTYACLVRIIRFLQTRGIRVVFFTPPYFVTYSELYYPQTIRSMKDRMQQLVEEYGVEYYDFSTDKDLIYNNLLFKDDDHLNADGAVVFSNELREAMDAYEAASDSKGSP